MNERPSYPEVRTEVESSFFIPNTSVLPVNMSGWSSAPSGRHKLPQVPCTIVDGSESGLLGGHPGDVLLRQLHLCQQESPQ